MNSKNNNKTRNDSPSTSSLPQSPYNLRRNQLQRGAVSKRSNSAKSKKDASIAIATVSTENLNASSTNSQIASDPVELTSNDSQHLSANNNTNEMERSEDEEKVKINQINNVNNLFHRKYISLFPLDYNASNQQFRIDILIEVKIDRINNASIFISLKIYFTFSSSFKLSKL
ncbi:unnamed protein product [Rotaria magnacalcarata]|uniref:Uncharacterized protein n=2 Tax=Rotaria magnacalcarata TaxID=392030 RepID=A0A816K8F4_9BILA|nr:unnamed protein product [Rotaria magnacalcarata]